jgi:hypothetical protein
MMALIQNGKYLEVVRSQHLTTRVISGETSSGAHTLIDTTKSRSFLFMRLCYFGVRLLAPSSNLFADSFAELGL